MEKKKPKFSYSRFHTLIFVIAITPITIYIFRAVQGKPYGDKLSLLIGLAIFAALQAFFQSRFYTLEKKDELVQHNLSKANKITLYTTLTVLFTAILLNDYCFTGLICSDFCWLTVMGAIALRSLLFTFFDAPSESDKEV